MTQPAKVQEPSMEEILASIRRIIADDEAKPAAAEKPASPPAAAKPAVMKDIPPSAIAPAPKPVAAPKPAPPPPAPAPEPVVSNNQDDIDAMLASLDAATPEADIRPAQPEPEPDVFELTDEMALPEPAPAPAAATFSKVEPQDDIEFTEAKAARRQPAYEPPFETAAPARPILSHSTVSAVEFRLPLAGQYRAEQQCADAGGSGQGNAAADAEILARRQFAGIGGADRQG